MMKKDTIYNALQNLSDNDLMYVWNVYCDFNTNPDDVIYWTDDLNDLLSGMEPLDIMRLVCDGVNLNYDFCKFTAYGLETAWTISDLIDLDELADYIADGNTDFGYIDFTDLSDELESA